eukprot:5168-Heterococcus_DN1.PRE.4
MHKAKFKQLNMFNQWKVTLSAAPTACVTLEKMLPMLLKPSDKLDKYSMKATIAPASSCPLLSWKQTIYSSNSVDKAAAEAVTSASSNDSSSSSNKNSSLASILVVSKNPISCRTSESNSCCLMRTFTRAPITVKMPPRMPVNTAVGVTECDVSVTHDVHQGAIDRRTHYTAGNSTKC